MSKEILKQRIQILREPLETWLTFYGKEGKTLNEEITRTLESEKDIFEIIEDIMMYLQSTRLIYNDIDNWFKIVINRHDEEPQEKFQDNFKTTQNIITTLEEEILNQDDQIKNQ